MRHLVNPPHRGVKAPLLGAGVGVVLGLGLVGLIGLVGLGRGGSAARAEAMKDPIHPQPSSLAPVDVEAFRQRYGQEALFRLKLGVEAGERSPTPPPGPTASCEAGWASSPQARAFQATLAREQWYEAGEALGGWRRLCGGGAGRGAAPRGLDWR